MSTNRVLIAIQARSTSKRLPGKVFELIDGRPMLDHVIEAARKSRDYINFKSHQTGLVVETALLVPFGDEIVEQYGRRVDCVEGSEDDVLSRYAEAALKYRANYIIRITSDCPLIPPFIISKIIKLGVINGYDYISNVDPRFRTALDGADCEMLSASMLKWLSENAVAGPEREHVTLAARERPPQWARVAAVIGFFDQSKQKLSVDTQEDLENVRQEFDAIREKLRYAERILGRERVHRF